jgi:putative membrane protein
MGGMMIFGVLMMVFGLLVVVGIILFAVWAGTQLFKSAEPRAVTAARGEDPLTILQRRYAGGEITREDYERIRRELTGSAQ